MRSYITSQKEIKDYTKKTTYVSDSHQDSLKSDLYYPLPEEYDIFTYVDPSLFTNRNTQQRELISDCLIYMRKSLLALYMSSGIICILPKLRVINEDSGTITFNWAYSTFRAFLSFDDEEGDYDSYYGIIFQSDSESVTSQTKKISVDNYKKMLDELLTLVIENA